MSGESEIGYYAPPTVRRAWATCDVLLGATALAMGMTACALPWMSSPIESAVARQLSNDYVLANRLTFWLATIPGGLLGVGALFLSVSLVARRVPTLGLAKVATLVALAATYLTALTLAGSK